MNKTLTLYFARILAFIMYIGSISFASYLMALIISGKGSTTMQDMFINLFIIITPLLIGTFSLVTSLPTLEQRYSMIRLLLVLGLILYVLLLFTILFFHGGRLIEITNLDILRLRLTHEANFVPFATIRSYINDFIYHRKNLYTIIENLLGNVLLCAPLGILLPLVFPSLHNAKKFILILLLSLFFIEMMQFILSSGSFDVDDILLNALGAITVFSFFRIKLFRKLLQRIYALPREV